MAREAETKVFIGGLSSRTTEDSLQEHFRQYGEVREIIISRDRATGRSRGFAFCLFENEESFDLCLKGTHRIDDTDVVVRPALPRDRDSVKDMAMQPSKVFVGGVRMDCTKEELFEYFSRFGGVAEVLLPEDRYGRDHRGFCFIIYEKPSSALKALGRHEALGRACEAKRARLKPNREEGRSRSRGERRRSRSRGERRRSRSRGERRRRRYSSSRRRY